MSKTLARVAARALLLATAAGDTVAQKDAPLYYYDGATWGWGNAELLFDYTDADNFKFITMQANNDRWEIGGRIDAIKITPDQFANEAPGGLPRDTDIRTELRVSGTTAELYKGAEGSEVKVDGANGERDFGDALNVAFDNEGQTLSIVSISGGQGNLVDNGNGTVTYTIPSPSFYGVDEYSYVISDGTNQTTATIRIDVVP